MNIHKQSASIGIGTEAKKEASGQVKPRCFISAGDNRYSIVLLDRSSPYP